MPCSGETPEVTALWCLFALACDWLAGQARILIGQASAPATLSQGLGKLLAPVPGWQPGIPVEKEGS